MSKMKKNNCTNRSALAHIERGKDYLWCSCTRSNSQPYCDGSHKSKESGPLTFQVGETGNYHLCQCKKTKNPPFCDGAHTCA